MEDKKTVEANLKRWLEILVRTENKVLNAKYFNQGIYYGLFIGLIANIWSALFYQDFLIKLQYHWRIVIFILLSLIGVYSIILLFYRWNDLSIASKFFKISIPRLYNALLKVNGIKQKSVSISLGDNTIGGILGKNWKKQKWYKQQKEENKIKP